LKIGYITQGFLRLVRSPRVGVECWIFLIKIKLTFLGWGSLCRGCLFYGESIMV